MLKTRRFGYDGKGQATIKNGSDPEAAWREVGGQPCILEAFVPFEREVSVVAARGHDGAVECFDVTENEHRDHILKVSRVPAALSEAGAREARRIAETIAQKFAYVGVLAVELFVLRDGGDSWSTRSRRGCTIPVTGRSTAPRCRNSSSTSGRWPAGRWPSRSATAASR